MNEQHTLWIQQSDRRHYIDNTDTRALSEERLRFVYDDMKDQEVEDFLDMFYEIKSGFWHEISDETGTSILRATLT